MTISLNMRISIADDILFRELDGESVILNLKSERYFGLDETGTRMWIALSRYDLIQQAYEALLLEYDVAPEQLRTDLYRLIEQLLAHGLVNVSNQ
ncbi:MULTISPECIES: PqqD family protein [Oscillatoriales]|nr:MULTISPECIES: PqqD family protein [Oscillatoriales]